MPHSPRPGAKAVMRKVCSPEPAWALYLALLTGQLPGGLLKLTWLQVRDGWRSIRNAG